MKIYLVFAGRNRTLLAKIHKLKGATLKMYQIFKKLCVSNLQPNVTSNIGEKPLYNQLKVQIHGENLHFNDKIGSVKGSKGWCTIEFFQFLLNYT